MGFTSFKQNFLMYFWISADFERNPGQNWLNIDSESPICLHYQISNHLSISNKCKKYLYWACIIFWYFNLISMNFIKRNTFNIHFKVNNNSSIFSADFDWLQPLQKKWLSRRSSFLGTIMNYVFSDLSKPKLVRNKQIGHFNDENGLEQVWSHNGHLVLTLDPLAQFWA